MIVQITVDQLRADLLTRFADRFVAHGLRRFLDQGSYYDQAFYAHAITETAVGHATLFTGALPAAHGIVGNEWLEAGKKRSSVEDPDLSLISSVGVGGRGAGPRALRVSTLGDELRLASDGAALVFGVSIKDRAAILPAGFGGKAFWYDEGSGTFVSSSYYYDVLPGWALLHARGEPTRSMPPQWDLLLPRDSYLRKGRDERSVEKPFSGSSSFPHPLVFDDPKERFRAIKHSPFGDELLLDFVAALLAHEPLGRDSNPDLLAISFSSTDIIGHSYGPESLEAEDNLLRLDRVIERLFEVLLSYVPQSELVVALSADHGISETPASLAKLGLPSGRHPAGAQLVAELNEALVQRHGPRGAFLAAFTNPCLWLDETKVAGAGLSMADAERSVAELVLARPGFARAFTRSELLAGQGVGGDIEALVRNSFDRARTGHVYLVPQPGWVLATDPTELAAMHGTPYTYDRAVPVALWGAGVPAQRIHRAVDPRDIAPTLALLARAKAPSGSSGELLLEAFPTPRKPGRTAAKGKPSRLMPGGSKYYGGVRPRRARSRSRARRAAGRSERVRAPRPRSAGG